MNNFIIKGILRDRTRTLFPFLTVAIGVALAVFLDAYLRGTTDSMFNTTARLACGHLMVTTRARAQAGEYATPELALLDVAGVKRELATAYPDISWTARIRFQGLLDIPDSLGNTRVQIPITGLAVDLTPDGIERTILRLDRSLVNGAIPRHPNEVLLSEQLNQRLGLKPGDRLTLITMTADGGMAIADFTLAGTIRFGITSLDRSVLVGNLTGISQTLALENGATEILGFFQNGVYDDRRAIAISQEYNARHASADEFAPLMRPLREASGMGQLIDIVNNATALILVIFIIAMAVVLWNAGLLNSLRRYNEIGIRLALGETSRHIYLSLLGEAFFIGLLGSAAGTLLGLAAGFYMEKVGLDISGMMKNASVLIDDVLRARVAPVTFFIGFIPGLFATLLGNAISGLVVFRRQTAQLTKELSE